MNILLIITLILAVLNVLLYCFNRISTKIRMKCVTMQETIDTKEGVVVYDYNFSRGDGYSNSMYIRGASGQYTVGLTYNIEINQSLFQLP